MVRWGSGIAGWLGGFERRIVASDNLCSQELGKYHNHN